jgi:glycosyltransferase involved in cell wall biosynthesis
MQVTPTRAWRIVHSEASTGWGGQEHRILAELTGFQRRGSRVWLLAPEGSGVSQRARQAGIETLPLDTNRWLYPINALRLARWLRRERIEVLNTHSSRDGWLLGIAGRLARTPLIVRSRHIDVDYPNRLVSRHVFTTFADHVITTSEQITRKLRDIFHLPAEHVSTIPTGIDLGRFTPSGPRAELPNPTPGVPLVGMVSVLRSWKGHSTFLAAAKLLVAERMALRFVIVGEGPIRRRLEREIAELGLSEVVTLTGHREDIPEVLRALSVLVIASTQHEGVPQIGLQALATQTPVIGSDVGGTPEIIRPGQTGRIFPAGNAGALAVAIRETLADERTTQACAGHGRALVERSHGLDAMLNRLEELYRRHSPGDTSNCVQES